MTTISGKIYQMKNAAGTENRFPRTVMEAVYGLNTYLQDQFSALADIYMPIEGITESKTGQEFVYRKSAATIKAKSLTLDRIYGKTLAWNQVLINGDFAGSITGWRAYDDNSISVAYGTNSILATTLSAGSGYRYGVYSQQFTNTIPNGHKVYASYFVKSPSAIRYGLECGNGNIPAVVVEANKWSRVSGILTIQINGASVIAKPIDNLAQGVTYEIKSVMLTDLTLLYGSEIDGLTDEQILAKFESEFPGYHDFGNKLISNDAESLETTGFNKFDESTWVVGKYRDAAGVESDIAGRRRSDVYFPCFPSTQYYFGYSVQNQPWAVVVCWYDANKNFISGTSAGNSIQTSPANAAFFKISGADHITGDTCINLSDPAKNGTYEPYRKTTLQLGLNNFKVKDGNGNITTITGGLKRAGTAFDEIVGNKLIQRIKRVNLGDLNWGVLDLSSGRYGAQITDRKIGTSVGMIDSKYAVQGYITNNADVLDKHLAYLYLSNYPHIYIKDSSHTTSLDEFTNSLNGVYLDYELATPIEYELVEPLVYSMAAGTTEERISPNADGLSAPFCCDMTYDANANNDSANAQYAATAGRLYNTHKLWGRDFDGSNDVSGALSGVTTIEASGNITTAAQLISTVATGTAPLSVASTTEVANLHSYTATKLHTQRTLWGQNFDGSGNVTGDMSSVGNIAFSASGKNIASLLYFDTTNSRVGVGASSPAYKLDVNGTLNASGNTTLGGTLGVTGNTTIGGTFTVGTSSVNKATTLYGALTASGAVSFSDTLTIAGLTTFNGNAILPANKTFTIGPSSGTHATLEWDATNSCVKITGNLRVTGWIEQQGTQS